MVRVDADPSGAPGVTATLPAAPYIVTCQSPGCIAIPYRGIPKKRPARFFIRAELCGSGMRRALRPTCLFDDQDAG